MTSDLPGPGAPADSSVIHDGPEGGAPAASKRYALASAQATRLDADHWVEAILTCAAEDDAPDLGAAFRRLQSRLEALRTRFDRDGVGTGAQWVANEPAFAELACAAPPDGRDPLAAFRQAVRRANVTGPCVIHAGRRLYLRAPPAMLDHVSLALLAQALAEDHDGRHAAPAYLDILPWMNEVDLAMPIGQAMIEGLAGAGCDRLDGLERLAAATAPDLWDDPLTPAALAGLDRLGARCSAPRERVLAALLLHVLGCAAGGSFRTGLVAPCRDWEGLDGCIGRFATTMPVSLPAQPAPTLGALLARLEPVWADWSQWNQRFDLDARLAASSHRRPNCALAFEPGREGRVKLDRWCDPSLAETLLVRIGEVGLVWQFDPARLDPQTIAILSGRLHATLTAASADSDCSLPAAPRGPPDSPTPPVVRQAQPDLLPLRIARQLGVGGARVALRSPTRSLSYDALDQLSRQVAAEIDAAGTPPGGVVAIDLREPVDQIVALVGIWRSGRAFLPLDPAWPAARRAAIVADAGCRAQIDENLLAAASARPLAVPEDATEWPRRGDVLAYVIYTSGSTGAPKGVMISHANLASYLAGLEATMDLGEIDSFAAIGSFAADLTYTALFAALARGATLHCPDGATLGDPGALIAWLSAAGLDALKTVPTLIRALLALDGSAAFLPRKWLILGGEALPPGLVQAISAVAPHCRLLNHYGPTETTIGVAAGRMAAATDAVAGVGPSVLGRALPGHADLTIVDPEGQPVPIGQFGEMLVGGAGVSLGYLGDPARTALAFVPGASGARRYRTGDRGRMLFDGRIEFAGRADQMVKLNGYRLDLGEVEAAMLAAAGVTDAAAVVVVDPDGVPVRLLGFYCANLSAPAADIAANCRDRLPAAAVPADFVRLPALPRTPSGKLDRQRLLVEHRARAADNEQRYGSPLSRAVAVELGRILGREPLAEQDDFFAAGGNSILAMRAVARLRAMVGKELDPTLLFDHPTPALAGAAIGSAVSSAVPIEPAPDGAVIPLSFAQERIWFGAMLLPPDAYVVPTVIDLAGEVDTARLGEALTAVADRHAVFRSRVRVVGGVPLVTFADKGHWRAEIVDVRTWDSARIDAHVAALTRRGFDLEREFPIRATLLTLGEDRVRLVLVAHHIAIDALSFPILMRDLACLYAGAGHQLPALPIQYGDFAVFQRSRPDSRADWWIDYLKDAPRRTPLPNIVAPTPDGRTGGRLAHALPAATLEQLRSWAREARLTLQSGLLGLFQILMARVSQTSDLVIGVPIAGRSRPETENLIGPFFDLVPMRGIIDERRPVVDICADAQAGLTRIWATGEGSFDAAAPRLRGSDSLQPWFNVLFAVREDEAENPVDQLLPELLIEVRRPSVPGGHYDLFFAVDVAAADAKLVAEFDANRLAPALVEVWLRLFAEMIDRATARTDVTGQEALAAAGGADRDRAGLVVAPAPSTRQRIAAALRQHAGRCALEDEAGPVSFAELDDLLRRYARLFRSRGLGPGMRVALDMLRDRHWPAAMLGAWHAGLTAVPMGNDLPPARRNFVLAAAGADAVLTGSPLVNGQGLPRLLRREDLAGADTMAGDDRPGIAYIMTTSGSSGTPKAVAVDWAALDRFVDEASAATTIGPDSIFLAATSGGFDISLLELLVPLITGATIRIAPASFWSDGDFALLDGVSHVQATPSSWRLALPRLARARFREALIGGEPIDPGLVDRIARHADRVTCLYGPTEATVWCSSTVFRNGERRFSPVPLGVPFSGTAFRLLDRAGAPAPPGVPAELCIAGWQLALGYLGSSGQTADRFVPDPEGRSGDRLYRTGDIAVAVGDALVFLGRSGGFLKVNGHRIDPGEVETALRSHPGVRQAAVDAIGAAAWRYLAAFVVLEPAFAETVDWQAELRRHAAEVLPQPFLPSAYLALDRLPVTASGKLDRAALPAPAAPLGQDEISDPLEHAVADEFARCLGRPVGPDDDFFLSGGTSLTASQLAHALAGRFGCRVRLSELFAAATVRGAARLIRRAGAVAGSGLPGLVADAGGTEAPLSPFQLAIWLAEQSGEMGAALTLSVDLTMSGPCDPERLRRAYADLIRRHDQLRSVFRMASGEPRQFVVEDVTPDFGVHSVASAREAAAVVDQERARPFDLGVPGPSRLRLLRYDDTRWQMLILVHHIAADEWSWRLILQDLEALYTGSVLAAAKPSYLDYAKWLQEPQVRARSAQQRDYWIGQLAEAPPLLALASARPRPSRRSFRGGSLPVVVPAELVATLESVGRARGAAPSAMLVAAWAWLLHLYSGSSVVPVGTAVANRRHPDTVGIVGNFANIVPLVVDFRALRTIGELIDHAHAVVTGALEHQECPFHEIVSSLGRPTSGAFPPVVQNFLVLHNTEAAVSRSQNWAIEATPLRYQTSEFDLDLGLTRVKDGLRGYLRYNADLYNANQLAPLIAVFLDLCTRLCGAPDTDLAASGPSRGGTSPDDDVLF